MSNSVLAIEDSHEPIMSESHYIASEWASLYTDYHDLKINLPHKPFQQAMIDTLIRCYADQESKLCCIYEILARENIHTQGTAREQSVLYHYIQMTHHVVDNRRVLIGYYDQICAIDGIDYIKSLHSQNIQDVISSIINFLKNVPDPTQQKTIWTIFIAIMHLHDDPSLASRYLDYIANHHDRDTEKWLNILHNNDHRSVVDRRFELEKLRLSAAKKVYPEFSFVADETSFSQYRDKWRDAYNALSSFTCWRYGVPPFMVDALQDRSADGSALFTIYEAFVCDSGKWLSVFPVLQDDRLYLACQMLYKLYGRLFFLERFPALIESPDPLLLANAMSIMYPLTFVTSLQFDWQVLCIPSITKQKQDPLGVIRRASACVALFKFQGIHFYNRHNRMIVSHADPRSPLRILQKIQNELFYSKELSDFITDALYAYDQNMELFSILAVLEDTLVFKGEHARENILLCMRSERNRNQKEKSIFEKKSQILIRMKIFNLLTPDRAEEHLRYILTLNDHSVEIYHELFHDFYRATSLSQEHFEILKSIHENLILTISKDRILHLIQNLEKYGEDGAIRCLALINEETQASAATSSSWLSFGTFWSVAPTLTVNQDFLNNPSPPEQTGREMQEFFLDRNTVEEHVNASDSDSDEENLYGYHA